MLSHSIPAVSLPLGLVESESVSHTCPLSLDGLEGEGEGEGWSVQEEKVRGVEGEGEGEGEGGGG